MGHLVRSLALAAALAERFHVVLLCGGRLPRGLPLPPEVEVRLLPPLGLDADHRLVSLDRRRTVARAQHVRRERILTAFEELRPAAILVELFPFGRKKFAAELLPLLERARAAPGRKPLVVCSLRDILVSRVGDSAHDERAVQRANAYFDLILVHADPRLARLEETFQPTTLLEVPIEYTGFVLDAPECAARVQRERRIIVSAGGGLVGEPLFRAALEAQRTLWKSDHLRTEVVAGPFLPEPAWQHLRRAAEHSVGLRVRRFVPHLRLAFCSAAGSISQCGYNTALDVVWSGVPALVVPYGAGDEDEQTRRARRLEGLGAVRVLPSSCLDGERLAHEVRSLLQFEPAPLSVDLQGAANSARLIAHRL